MEDVDPFTDTTKQVLDAAAFMITSLGHAIQCSLTYVGDLFWTRNLPN